MIRSLLKSRRGAALVEYGLLVAGVALVAAAAISVFGHKTASLLGGIASVLPGAHAEDNAPIVTGALLETTDGSSPGGLGSEPITLDLPSILEGGERLGDNLGVPVELLIVDPPE